MSTDPHESHLEAAHGLLRRALKELAPDDRPPPPWHLGGPKLTFSAFGQIRMCLACSDLLLDAAPAAQRDEIARVKATVERFLLEAARMNSLEWSNRVYEARPGSPLADLKENLEASTESARSDSDALYCGRRAASGAATYTRGKPDLVVSASSSVAVRVVQALLANPNPVTARAFVADLDARMCRDEFTNNFRQRIKSDAPVIDRVLFRGPNARGDVEYWIVRLPNGAFGLLGKFGAPKPKWGWVEGDRHEVLASVPDQLKADAARLTA